MYIILFRTIILYIIIIISMRLMGKRQIGQLQPSELVVALLLSEIAATPMQDPKIPMLLSIIPIITLTFMQIIFSYFQTKFRFLSTLIDGKATVLITDGKFNEKSLTCQRITLEEIFEEMRINSITNINEIAYAILETNGKITILSKKDMINNKTYTKEYEPTEVSLPIIFVKNGKLYNKELKRANLNLDELNKILTKNNIDSIKDTYIAFQDYTKKVFCQKRGG